MSSDVGREILSHLQGRSDFPSVLFRSAQMKKIELFPFLLFVVIVELYRVPQSRLPQFPESRVCLCVPPHLARYFGLGFGFSSGSLPGIEM